MTRARVGNAWSDDYSGQMCLGGLSVGRGGDGVQDGEQEAAAQPQPPLALGLAPGALPGPPSAVQHAREPLSTGCPSPWRPALPSPLPVPSLCRPSLWRRRELSPSEPHCAEKRYGTTAQLPAALPDPPGPGHHPDPSAAARRSPPCGPRGISCQRPWSRSPSPGLSPSHSRAAESFEKNAAGREGLLRTERLCGGNCCSALSPPRPPGGAALSAANAKPGARSPAGRSRTGQGGRGAEEAPGGGGGGSSATPCQPSPPDRPRMGPRRAGQTARNRGPAGQGPVPALRLAGWDLRPVSAPLQGASLWGVDTRGSRPVAQASSAHAAGPLSWWAPPTRCVSQEAGARRQEPQRLDVEGTQCGRAGGDEPRGSPAFVSAASQARPPEPVAWGATHESSPSPSPSPGATRPVAGAVTGPVTALRSQLVLALQTERAKAGGCPRLVAAARSWGELQQAREDPRLPPALKILLFPLSYTSEVPDVVTHVMAGEGTGVRTRTRGGSRAARGPV